MSNEKSPRVISKEYQLFVGNYPYAIYVTTDYGLVQPYADRYSKERDLPASTTFTVKVVEHYAPRIVSTVKASELVKCENTVSLLQAAIDDLSKERAPSAERRREINRLLYQAQREILDRIST